MRNLTKSRIILLIFLISLLPIQSAAAEVIQRAAGAGEQYGSAATGGAFSKSCPDGYVVFSVAVSINESFGYTEGFNFSCVNVLEDGTLGNSIETFEEVTSHPRNRTSMCAGGKALTGVRITLKVDPNNASTFYVNDLGSNCSDFLSARNGESLAMARGTTSTHSSDCSTGFVTGFAGRKGAGLDRVGVLCSSFTKTVAEEPVVETDPITNTLMSETGPMITVGSDEITCKIGNHKFYFRESILKASQVESTIFSLFLDGARYASASSDNFFILPRWILGTTPKQFIGTATVTTGTWKKSELPTYRTLACEVLAYQEHATALSNSALS